MLEWGDKDFKAAITTQWHKERYTHDKWKDMKVQQRNGKYIKNQMEIWKL